MAGTGDLRGPALALRHVLERHVLRRPAGSCRRAGNSGAEIATDLSDNGAAFVALSVRTPPVVVPRDPFGMPVQRTSLLLSMLPPSIANRIGRATARLALGDLTRYGLPQGEFAPYTTKRIPLIDVGFVDALKAGRVAVRPAVDRLTPAGAVFADGSSDAFDAIIAATGFTTGLEALIDVPGVLDRPRRAARKVWRRDRAARALFHRVRAHAARTLVRSEPGVAPAGTASRAVSRLTLTAAASQPFAGVVSGWPFGASRMASSRAGCVELAFRDTA